MMDVQKFRDALPEGTTHIDLRDLGREDFRYACKLEEEQWYCWAETCWENWDIGSPNMDVVPVDEPLPCTEALLAIDLTVDGQAVSLSVKDTPTGRETVIDLVRGLLS
jgi:hypothetical protein